MHETYHDARVQNAPGFSFYKLHTTLEVPAAHGGLHHVEAAQFSADKASGAYCHSWLEKKTGASAHYGVPSAARADLDAGRSVVLLPPSKLALSEILGAFKDMQQQQQQSAATSAKTKAATSSTSEAKQSSDAKSSSSSSAATTITATKAAATATTTSISIHYRSVVCPIEILVQRAKALDEKCNERVVAKKLKKQYSQEPTAAENGDNSSVVVTTILNDGSVVQGVEAFLVALGFDPDRDIPSVDPADLKRCAAQDYLKRTVFPDLAPALTLLELQRPANAVEVLALQLIKQASMRKHHVAKLIKAKQVRQQLRQSLMAEYNVSGRV
jgi:hypothetical protein